MRPQKPPRKPANTRQPRPAKAAPVITETLPAAGASQSRVTLAGRFDAYVGHHSLSAIESLLRLLRTPGQSLMTWLVIAIALALPATLFASLQNLQTLGQRWDGNPQLSVFLKDKVEAPALGALQEQLQRDARVQTVVYMAPEQALQEFEAQTGLGQALRALEHNPLPAALILRPHLSVTPAQLTGLVEELQRQPLVDDVVVDLAWVKRMQEILALAQRVVLGLGALLAAGVILVVGNTIRLAIENRRDEILVVKLVGGTDAWVRRPFLYTGLWYGMGGGIFACLLLALSMAWLAGPVATLAAHYQSDFRLQGLGFIGSLTLMLLAGLIGWLGAWVAVGRHLSQIKPT